MRSRRTLVGSAGIIAVALGVTGAVAFACIPAARLGLSSASGKPGDVITISGAQFTMPANVTTGIQIRWGEYDGPLLAEAHADATGNFTTTFTVPDAAAGAYPVTAVLFDANGDDVPGTPTRTIFEIRNATAAPAAAPPDTAPAPSAAPVTSGSGSSSSPLGLIIGLGVLGLALFGGGFVAITRSRRGGQPSPARVRRD